jgi:SSS family solute:Na+ symporter
MWWELSGIFAAGMLGIFLLGIFSRRTGNHAAMIAAAIGILVIAWMTFSPRLPASFGMLKNHFDKNMVIVIGTLSIFLVGVLLNGPEARRPKDRH